MQSIGTELSDALVHTQRHLIASLVGPLMGAYHSMQIPDSEKLFLLNYFELFDELISASVNAVRKHEQLEIPRKEPGVALDY